MDTKLHILLRILLGGLALYLVYCAILFFMQRRIVFARQLNGPSPPDLSDASEMERIWLDTRAGRTESWLLPTGAEARPGPAVIFAHGSLDLIDDWAG